MKNRERRSMQIYSGVSPMSRADPMTATEWRLTPQKQACQTRTPTEACRNVAVAVTSATLSPSSSIQRTEA